jgi:ankyrin repeat protein
MKKDDGFAPLHLAALNGHRDVTNTLLVTVGILFIAFYSF